MKFTVSKDLRSNAPMRYLLISFSTIMLLFLALDIINKTLRFGSSTTEIENSILGNEEDFMEPISILSALELVHLDLFIAVILLFIIGSIFMRIEAKFKTPLLALTMLLSIFSFASFLISIYFGKIFLIISIFTFLIWHLSAMLMLLISLNWLRKKNG